MVFSKRTEKAVKHTAVRSSTLWSCLAFGLLNVAFFNVVRNGADSNGVTSVVGQFLSSKETPKSVILGSSVARHICNSVEPSVLQQLQVSSLSYNLQMVSDSYLLVDKLLQGTKKPSLVVFCVCPRDFIDNDQNDLTRTTTFRRFVSPLDLWGLTSPLNLSLTDCSKVVYNYFCSIYDGRAGIQSRFTNWASLHLAGISTEETAPVSARAFWERSIKEYTWRYQGINAAKLSERINVLKNCIALCNKRGIETVVVNAPLSKDNLKLLPPDFYKRYVEQLHETALSGNSRFIDLQNDSQLTVADFDDCAHVNKVGGKKVFTEIRPFLKVDASCAQTQRFSM